MWSINIKRASFPVDPSTPHFSTLPAKTRREMRRRARRILEGSMSMWGDERVLAFVAWHQWVDLGPNYTAEMVQY